MPNRLLKNRVAAGLLIGLIIAIAMSILTLADPLKSLHLRLADSLYTHNEPSKDIVIIAIDEKSNEKPPVGLGRYAQWSRDNFTQLLEKLQTENPKVIAFDVIFNNHTQALPLTEISQFISNISKTASNKEKLQSYEKYLTENSNPLQNAIDERFAAKLAEFDNVILAMSANSEKETLPLKKFSENTHLGNINIRLDEDGIFRRNRTITGSYESLALKAVRLYQKKETLAPEEMTINYFADPFGYRMIPFVDVLNRNFPAGAFTDKIVLVGVTSFKELQDDVITPRSNKLPMPGVETWANQIQTILEGKFLRAETLFEQTIVNTALALGLTVALNFLGILLAILFTALLFGGYIFAAYFFYHQGIILNMIYPFITLIIIFISSWIYKYFVADRKKRQIKEAFGRYVSKELVEQISKNPEIVKIGGEKKNATVFFSDLVDSTALAESSNIENWVNQMNQYFTAMEKVIKNYGGTLDKYEGDAIMAFWNAPVSQEDHVSRAYTAALQMKKTLYELNHNWQQLGLPALNTRIGINTGEVLVGNFGSEERFDYTVMGDNVNVASRMESAACKTYVVSIAVAGEKPSEKFFSRELDTVYLPGKKMPVQIYELICLAEEATDDLKKIVTTYLTGLKNYRASNWQEAIKNFQLLPEDKPAQVLLARCSALLQGQKVAGLDSNMIFGISK